MESCNSKVFEGRLHGDPKKKEGKVKKRARGSIWQIAPETGARLHETVESC